MINQKHTGSYYTPETLSDFLTSHIFNKYIHSVDLGILEPSCGDGQFVSSLFNTLNVNNYNSIDLTICDINDIELAKTLEKVPHNQNLSLHVVNNDYLDYFLNNEKRYSLIIGNPPYIRKKNMEDEQIAVCENVHKKGKSEFNRILKSNGKINNIWTAFVEAAIMSLSEDGVICFVIPAEIMHVNYTKELRRLIQSEFDRVEIFAFNELIFEGIQQDVVAIICVKGIQNTNEHGVSFYQVDYLDDLNEPKFTEKHSNIHRLNLDKWTNYILSDDDLNYIENIKNLYNPIKHYCERAQVGIVSAANDYFIISQSDVKKNKLNQLNDILKPILSKGSVLPSVLDFKDDDYNALLDKNERVFFVNFPDLPKDKLPQIAKEYISIGEKMTDSVDGGLDKRYKMTKRDNWYHVPTVWVSEGLYVKRSHLFPKMIVNSANSLATDSFYRIQMNENYRIKDLVFSFYNSLTFVIAELEGRFYGGGVLELTPNEFKNLSIPYASKITDFQFNKLDRMIREDSPINNILDYTDNILFKNTNIDIARLRIMRQQLVNRRIKKHLN